MPANCFEEENFGNEEMWSEIERVEALAYQAKRFRSSLNNNQHEFRPGAPESDLVEERTFLAISESLPSSSHILSQKLKKCNNVPAVENQLDVFSSTKDPSALTTNNSYDTSCKISGSLKRKEFFSFGSGYGARFCVVLCCFNN